MENSDTFGVSIFKSRIGEGGDISRRVYNLIIGACLIWGFAFNYFICAYFGDTILKFAASGAGNYLIFIIGYFVLAIAGIMICMKSQSPGMSFLGYNLVVLPLGAMLSIVLQGYSTQIITYAFGVTGIVTALMICLSVAFPQFFLSIGRGLFISLLCVVLVEFLLILIFRMNFVIIDFAVVLIFCGYIGFD